MELECQLLLYLDKRRCLVDIREQCENFMTILTSDPVNKFPPFRYTLEIDVMELLDCFPELGKVLLAEPLKWKLTCNRILFACLKSIGHESTDVVHYSQLAVVLRLKNISPPIVEVNPPYFKGLVCFKGQLIDVSKPTPYVYHTVWSCPEECDNNETIFHSIPKTTPKCYICRGSLFENSGFRRCGEQVTATFKVRNNALPKTFRIVDDLISTIKLGSEYLINAVVLKTFTEVWSIEPITALPAPITIVPARDIIELYSACDGLPWKFIYCLASTIGSSICPLNCFIHLKINLLLSLTSVKANIFNGSSIIHVLISGYDTGIVGAIMKEGAKLADTSLLLGTTNSAVSTTLIGCSGGICCMSLPLHTYSSTTISAIMSSIESGEIVSELHRTKLRSAVWAQGRDFKKIVFFNVAMIFGTVCRGDYGEYEDDLAEFIVQQALNSNKTITEDKEAMRDVAHYIGVVAGIHVELNAEAEKLLRSYFLAVRKERPRGVSMNSMESLVATCLNSARLCRRDIANTEDAALAIWLHVSGSPEPRYVPDEYVRTPADIKELHKVFNNFKDWLLEFTSTYGY